MLKNKVVANASWIIVCKIAQSILAFFVGILTARYLGPANYGLINYAAAMVSFVAPIMYLGFNSTLVQEFVNRPNMEGKIIGTAIGTSIISSILCIIGINAFVFVANGNEQTTIIVCLLYSFILLFQAIDLIQYWFQYKLLSKFTSLAMLFSYFTVSLYKIFLLITQKSVYWFALSNTIEFFLIAVILFVCLKKISNIKLSFSKALAVEMFKRSNFFILSNMMIVIFAQTDRIMLKFMLGAEETGYYSAAISLSMITAFVFGAIIDSLRPVILEAKKTNIKNFEQNMKMTYCIVICLSLAQSIVVTILSKPIVLITYGQQYANTILILKFVVWYTIFSYIGGVRSIWVLANNFQKYLWSINLAGAIVNVLLNYFLIPIWGAIGAAIASIVTQFFINVFLGYVIPAFRPNNKLMEQSLNPFFIKNIVMKVVDKKEYIKQ